MARIQKFSEDLLLEAVVKYAETTTGKIKATELASWASSNIAGLEGVRDYHFMRPIKEPQSGKQSSRKKLCTIRMEEINQARSLTERVKKNTLLKASSIDAFMEQPDYVQRRQISEARETVDSLLAKNAALTRENEALHTENKQLKASLSDLFGKIEALQREYTLLSRKVSILMKTTDEAERKGMLAQMGVVNGDVDLDTYAESLTQGIQDVMDISRAIMKHVAVFGDVPSVNKNPQPSEPLSDAVISGLRFGGDSDE